MMLHRLRFMRSNLSEFGDAAPIGQSTSWSSSEHNPGFADCHVSPKKREVYRQIILY
jgi:hypothetical protein